MTRDSTEILSNCDNMSNKLRLGKVWEWTCAVAVVIVVYFYWRRKLLKRVIISRRWPPARSYCWELSVYLHHPIERLGKLCTQSCLFREGSSIFFTLRGQMVVIIFSIILGFLTGQGFLFITPEYLQSYARLGVKIVIIFI